MCASVCVCVCVRTHTAHIYVFVLECIGNFLCAQHVLEVSEKLYNAATEAICSALTVCEDTDGYQPLANILVTEVKKLAPVFQASILSEDIDRSVPYCTLYNNTFGCTQYKVDYCDSTHYCGSLGLFVNKIVDCLTI